MRKRKIALIFEKASCSAKLAVIFFALFIVEYFFLIETAISPLYFKNFILVIPSVLYGIITYFTVKGKLKTKVSTIISKLLVIVLIPVMVQMFFAMAILSAIYPVTDTGRYEKVLKLIHYQRSPLIKYFPDKIPEDAKNIVFSYNQAFLQGGENFDLKFQTDSNSIKDYMDEFSRRAKWIGKASDSEVEKCGIRAGAFEIFGYDGLPEDFTIYLVYGNPNPDGYSNHGKFSLVAISEQRNEIIFLEESW